MSPSSIRVWITFKQAPPPPPPPPPLCAGQTGAAGIDHLPSSVLPMLASLSPAASSASEVPPGFHFMGRPFET